jgi:hypothetical protein
MSLDEYEVLVPVATLLQARRLPPGLAGCAEASVGCLREPVEQSILVQFSENTYAVCRTHIHQAIGYSWRNEFVASPEVVA